MDMVPLVGTIPDTVLNFKYVHLDRTLISLILTITLLVEAEDGFLN